MALPQLVIVFGLPGSGKSYFARRLADRLSAVHVNSDRIRKEIGGGGKYSRDDKLSVYVHMAHRVRALLENRKVVIVVDATFYIPETRDLFVALASEFKIPTRFIEIKASPAIVKERLRAPRKDSEADFAVYQLVKEQFEELKTPHLVIESTDNNIETMLEEALAYIYSNDR